jgi:hypothetical protein
MAQEPGKVARIGLLGPAAAANDPMVEAFKQGLRGLVTSTAKTSGSSIGTPPPN